MGHAIRLELTLAGLQVKLANHFTTGCGLRAIVCNSLTLFSPSVNYHLTGPLDCLQYPSRADVFAGRPILVCPYISNHCYKVPSYFFRGA